MFKKTKDTDNKLKRGGCRSFLAGALALVVVLGGIYSHFGGFGTGPCADTDEFAKYAGELKDISVPEGTRIVALGEATHGNKEFQELKLDVFKLMVEKYGVRAFALEADCGCCEYVNRYIHGGKGSAEKAAAELGFVIYRTDEMEALIEYMRDFNKKAEPGDDIVFYGFDMQRINYNMNYLLDAAKKAGIKTDALSAMWDGESFKDKYSYEQKVEAVRALRSDLIANNETVAVHFADVVLQNIELGHQMEKGDIRGLRDEYMAENIMWISKIEEYHGHSCIMVSGHDGHIMKFNEYPGGDKATGNILSDRFGDRYFAIGTDFGKTSCNLPKRGSRVNKTFYSWDPLAKAADKCGMDRAWLDFTKLPSDSKLYTTVNEPMNLGSLGENYSILVRILPHAYRESFRTPSECYDGMILVPSAHPTVIK